MYFHNRSKQFLQLPCSYHKFTWVQILLRPTSYSYFENSCSCEYNNTIYKNISIYIYNIHLYIYIHLYMHIYNMNTKILRIFLIVFNRNLTLSWCCYNVIMRKNLGELRHLLISLLRKN